MYFFGISVTAIRIYEMVMAISVLFLTYFTGKEIFCKKVGMISASLLSILPSFVFYSRQSALYDWSDLCIALLVLIFGIRYLRTLKHRYLFVALLLIGIGVYEYLWFVWIIIGFMFTIPLWINKFKNRFTASSQSKYKIIAVSSTALVLGFSHVLVGYFISSVHSLIPFLTKTVSGDNSAYLHASNTDFISNMSMRIHDVYDFLAHPQVAFLFANSNHSWNVTSYVFPAIFLLTTIVSIWYVVKRKKESRRIASIFLIISGIFISSSFTVSEFLPIQMSVILPFMFLSIGKGFDIISNNMGKARLLLSSRKINYLLISSIVIVGLTQLPLLASGFNTLDHSSTADTSKVYEKIYDYANQNHLKIVSVDFFTAKVIPFYTNGNVIPITLQWTLPQMEELGKFHDPMQKIGSLDLRDNDYLFLIYAYPTPPDCSLLSIEQTKKDPVCSVVYTIENTALVYKMQVKTINFSLADGSSFITALRLEKN